MKTYRHYFIEGAINTGKSTLIRECIKPYTDYVGGFSCKRYVDDYGEARAFGLVSATDLEVETRYDADIHGDPQNGIMPKVPNIFMVHQYGRTYVNMDVFETIGVDMLISSEDKSLILLDEIGGIELLSDRFKKTLLNILSSEKTCIGVLKLIDERKLKHSKTEADFLRNHYNEKLKYDLQNTYNSKLVRFDRNSKEKIKIDMKSFLRDKFENGLLQIREVLDYVK